MCVTNWMYTQMNKTKHISIVPKQWKYWCRKYGLKPQYGGRKNHDWLYLIGHGYVWRVNNKGKFECGDSIDQFDRWALCDIDSTIRPSTELAFKIAIKQMLQWKNTDKQGT